VIKYELKPYQKEGIKYALTHHYSIIGDGMGLGKTLQAIEVIKRTQLKTVVICPALLRETWGSEIRKFSDIKPLILTSPTKADFQVAIISYSMVDKMRSIFKDVDLIICDEVHYLKNIESKRTRAVHNILRTFPPSRFLGLSGTAIKNRVPEFYSLLLLCSYNPANTSGIDIRSKYPDYWSFCKKFAKFKQFRVKGRMVTKFYGHAHVDELREILKDKYIRRRASEVLDLKDIVRKDVLLNCTDVDEALLAAWNENTDSYSTFKRNSAKVKASATAKYAKALHDAGEGPLIIFSDHIEPTYMIAQELKGISRVITGQMPMKDRDKIVQEFQAGKIDYLIATIGSLSVGVTLTAANNIIFNDMSWVPADVAQAEKRIHRIGQTKLCVIHRVFWGKVDAKIGRELTDKIKTLAAVL
jgi:SNF2 family DNA or RNA helicase